MQRLIGNHTAAAKAAATDRTTAHDQLLRTETRLHTRNDLVSGLTNDKTRTETTPKLRSANPTIQTEVVNDLRRIIQLPGDPRSVNAAQSLIDLHRQVPAITDDDLGRAKILICGCR